jgi:hypothetical protein
MGPTIGAGHGALPEHFIETGKAINLKDAAISGQMTTGMFSLAIAGVIADHAGRREPAKGAVIAHVIPDSGDIGLVSGQQRQSGVIGMEPITAKNMGFKEKEQGPCHDTDGTDLVRQCRETDRNAFGFKPVALRIERLVQTIFLEGEVGEKVRPEHAARRHMEWRRGLADFLATTTGDLLADRADNLVARRHLLKRFGDVGG